MKGALTQGATDARVDGRHAFETEKGEKRKSRKKQGNGHGTHSAKMK